MTFQSDFGQFAEQYVAQYLESKGYFLVERNYKKRWGEVDIIVKKNDILIFVEVKAANKEITGLEPEVRISREKIKKVVRAARTYLAERKYTDDQEWQVDVVSIIFNKDRGVAKIKHFKNIEM